MRTELACSRQLSGTGRARQAERRRRRRPLPWWRAAAPLTALLGGAGCLLPPPIEEIPAADNAAPRIEPRNLSPDPTDGPELMSVNCPEYRFFFSVSDPNGDTLYWRVFLDYGNDLRALDTLPSEYTPGATGETLSFTVNPNNFVGPIDDPHTVELLVADRPFSEAPREPLGRVLADPEGKIDSVIWAVELTREDAECIVQESSP